MQEKGLLCIRAFISTNLATCFHYTVIQLQDAGEGAYRTTSIASYNNIVEHSNRVIIFNAG